MNPRIVKEFRALRLFWIAALALSVVPLAWIPRYPDMAVNCMVGYVLGCVLLGVASFGSEWNHQTLELWLSQPSPRRQLWRDKILVLGGALATVCLAFLPCLIFMPEEGRRFFRQPSGWIWIALPVCWSLGMGPLFTLLTGHVVAALLATLFAPILWIMGMQLLLPPHWDQDETSARVALCAFVVPLMVVSFTGCLWSRFRFQHLETMGANSLAIGWLDRWIRPSRISTTGSTRRPRGPVGKLLAKEFHLHETTFLIFGAITLLSALPLALGQLVSLCLPGISFDAPIYARVTSVIGWQMVLVAAFAPLVAGSMAVAEERQLGLIEGQLTLPATRRRQWLIKAFVVYGVTVVLGILMPALVLWLADRMNPTHLGQLFFENGEQQFIFLVVVCLSVSTVSLFASSLTNKSLHAILLSVVTLGLTVIMMGMVGLQGAQRVLDSIVPYLAAWPVPSWFGWVVALGSLLGLQLMGYANYRRLDTPRHVIPQVALAVLALILVPAGPLIVTVWHQQNAMVRQFGIGGSLGAAYLRGESPEKVIPALAAMLEDPARARQAIALLIRFVQTGSNRPRFAEAVPVFVKALRHADAEVRRQATVELRRFSDDYGDILTPDSYQLALNALHQNLADPDPQVREETMFVLGAWRDNPGKLVPLLAGRLSNPDTPQNERLGIVRTLANLGPDAASAVPALTALIRSATRANPAPGDRQSEVRRLALNALQKIDPEAYGKMRRDVDRQAPQAISETPP